MATKTDQRKIKSQNRWLLNIAWWLGLLFIGEGYIYSPLPGRLAGGLVNDTHGLFWPTFWSVYIAFLLVQSIIHLKVMRRYFPEWGRANTRFVVGVPLTAFLTLSLFLFLLVPGAHML